MKAFLLATILTLAAASVGEAQAYVRGHVGVRLQVPRVSARVVVGPVLRPHRAHRHAARPFHRGVRPVHLVRYRHDRGIRRMWVHQRGGRTGFVRGGLVRIY